MPFDNNHFDHAREMRLAREEAEDRYFSDTNAIMEEIALLPPVEPIMYGKKDGAMLGNSGYERNERDFYPTPANVTHALCRMLLDKSMIAPSAVIWEPACGDGQMVRVLKDYFAGVIATDIVPLEGSGGFEANFLNSTPKLPFTAIITNPPFGEMIDAFMKRALTHLRNRDSKCDLVAFVARHELDCGVKRNKYFRDCPEFAAKITLTWRPRWIADSTGSPRHNYAVFVWMRKELHTPLEPRLYYANNPDKKR